MKDTTTTIDDEIDQIYSMIRNSLRLQSASLREAEIIRTKSRIREIIKDKARSYVLEVIGEDDDRLPISDASMSYQNGRNDLRAELRELLNGDKQ